MKLYATITTSKGKKEGKGDDKWLEIELTCKNNQVGRVILDYQGGDDWDLFLERPDGTPSYLIDSSESYKKVKKAKAKGDVPCIKCGGKRDVEALICNNCKP